jgi:hypothetical protein
MNRKTNGINYIICRVTLRERAQADSARKSRRAPCDDASHSQTGLGQVSHGVRLSFDSEIIRQAEADDAESMIAHETTDALTLSGHARTPSGCKSGDVKKKCNNKKASVRYELAARTCATPSEHIFEIV